MGFYSQDAGAAATVFFAFYSCFLGLMILVAICKGLKTVYTFILVFTLFRFGGQLCGVVYAKLGPDHWHWLIAYLVLGAEGYFTLIFAGLRFTCNAQEKAYGESWILTSGPATNIKGPFPLLRRLTPTWIGIFHLLLIPANVLVILGGSLLSGMTIEEINKGGGKLMTSKALRTVGQLIFLLMTIAAISLNIYIYKKERVRTPVTIAVMCLAPFLLVRGIFGILSIFITKMNYYQLSNYSDTGMKSELVVYEYVLSTTMEFIAACCLMSKLFFEHREGRSNWNCSVENVELKEGRTKDSESV